MKTRYAAVTMVLFLVLGLVVAQEKTKPVYISSGENTTDSGRPELSKIVDLCAKDEKKKFEKKWSNYVIENNLKGTELQETIKRVSDEAAIQRKNNQRMNGNESDSEAWKEEQRKLMNELARLAKMI
jgi:hypothetical protein